MRLVDLAVAAMLWQSALLVNIGAVALPEHLRFERDVALPAQAAGLACVALDAAVMAHTASAAHNDLRLYRGYPGSAAQAEVPYLLTESGPEPVDATEIAVEHLRRGPAGAVLFDLAMPGRMYSELDLQIGLRNFVGTAVVTGEDSRGRRKALGSFGIFDLSGQHLGRWTALLLAESDLPLLHVELDLRTAGGLPVTGVPLGMVEGVAVPPSRARQTVFTPVAVTNRVLPEGEASVATLRVPAHVPVEQVRFGFVGDAVGNFARPVLVEARATGQAPADTEVVHAGLIEHVRWPSGDPRLNPIEVSEDKLEATLGATLGDNAEVRVAVENGELPPLPIRSVTLAMRERRVCFEASPGANYTLRYGDPALAAPLYADEPRMGAGQPILAGHLGPERRKPQWRPRQETRSYLARHPEMFWLTVLVCCGMMGGTALHYVQHRGGAARA